MRGRGPAFGQVQDGGNIPPAGDPWGPGGILNLSKYNPLQAQKAHPNEILWNPGYIRKEILTLPYPPPRRTSFSRLSISRRRSRGFSRRSPSVTAAATRQSPSPSPLPSSPQCPPLLFPPVSTRHRGVAAMVQRRRRGSAEAATERRRWRRGADGAQAWAHGERRCVGTRRAEDSRTEKYLCSCCVLTEF